MTIDESNIGQNWLKQFSLVDREIARQLLRSLRLVSHTRFETGIASVLTDLLVELHGENVALFHVTEAAPDEIDGAPPRRLAGGSSDRVRSFNENFSRLHGPRVQAHPTVHSMRAQRIKNVVLIDDFIGTGRRISTYLRDGLSPTVKSWISWGWTKLWIVAYAGLDSGVHAVAHRGYHLSEESVRLATPPQKRAQFFSPLMLAFCRARAERTRHRRIAMGFGDGAVGMVFEHSCPNNAPVILWSDGPKYNAFFPNRGIPDELKSLFSQEDVNRPASVLWDFSQYRLALAMLREPKLERRQGSHWKLLLMLGLASRSKWDDARIAGVLGIPISEVMSERLDAYKVSLLDPQTHLLTSFGRAILDRIRQSAVQQQAREKRTQRALVEPYYPLSCNGLVRH
jgi:hypothetical protein